jgi:hypothetical protein
LEEAMRARDVLSGRKIDVEKGCVIKAEMAKKNLHTRKGISSSSEFQKSMYSINFSSFRRRSTADGYDQFYKGPLDYSQHYDPGISYSNDIYMHNNPSVYTNQYFDGSGADIFDPFAHPDPILDTEANQTGIDQFYSNDTLSPIDEYESKLPPVFGSSRPSRGFSSVLYNSDMLLSKSLGSMSVGELPGAESFNNRSGSFSYSSNISLPGADQNPPCNTLYVGNLPNDNCEEELRHMFQVCPGYKRLCFKTRMNGPMCFVEVMVY